MADTMQPGDAAVLVSGGVDSAILCVDLLRRHRRVFPLYVRFGLRWEAVELAGLRDFLDAAARPGLMPLSTLDEPVGEVYGRHWSTGASDVPRGDDPDEAVYLPGRNLLLVAKAAVWCRLHGVDTLAMGTLASNPFPDGTPEFFAALESAVNLGLAGHMRLVRPYAGMSKREALARGLGLPVHRTFSCLDPVDGLHCGTCNKCAERRKAFGDLDIDDATPYAGGPRIAT